MVPGIESEALVLSYEASALCNNGRVERYRLRGAIVLHVDECIQQGDYWPLTPPPPPPQKKGGFPLLCNQLVCIGIILEQDAISKAYAIETKTICSIR